MTYYLHHDSQLGKLLLAASDRGITGIYFEEHKHFKGMQGWTHAPDHPHLRLGAGQLDEYFACRRTAFDLPLDLAGTEFQRTVWKALMRIPFGQTVSYLEHAQSINNPKALRAVGAAIGRNPVSIIVPCHRVIGTSRSLTGYAGGLERKSSLLALEGIRL